MFLNIYQGYLSKQTGGSNSKRIFSSPETISFRRAIYPLRVPRKVAPSALLLNTAKLSYFVKQFNY